MFKKQIPFLSVLLCVFIMLCSCNKTDLTAATGSETSTQHEVSDQSFQAEINDNSFSAVITETERSAEQSVVNNTETSTTFTDSTLVTESIATDKIKKYTNDLSGIVLSVYAPEKISKNSEFYVVAKVTNSSDDAIEYWVPFTEGLHEEIDVTIKDVNGKEFTDRDTFGVSYDAGLKKVLLKPDESYTETICFIPGWAETDFLNPGAENWDITYFDEGTYTGTAVFDWDAEEGDDSVSLEFPVTVV